MIFPTKCQNHVINCRVLDYIANLPFVFDPRQLPTLDLSIGKFTAIKAFQNPSPTLLGVVDLLKVQGGCDPQSDPPALWESPKGRFPTLSKIVSEVIWMPVTSVDLEKSFSQYKHEQLKGKPCGREHHRLVM